MVSPEPGDSALPKVALQFLRRKARRGLLSFLIGVSDEAILKRSFMASPCIAGAGSLHPAPKLSGFCLLIKRAVYEKINGGWLGQTGGRLRCGRLALARQETWRRALTCRDCKPTLT
jgi:hypothetical protein